MLIPDAELMGLKSELLEYGVNVKGEISATDNFAFSSGNVTIIVPSEDGSTDTRYNYAYEIEDGSPPQIMSLSFIPKGRYGILEFPDVTHALGYEWQLEGQDPDIWNFFNDSRPLINPSEIEVTPGNLQVTIKFPNIATASSYEYMLESETHEVAWTRFTGTLSNGIITTIISNLEEGVEYDLWLRVGSPWIGTAVKVKVFGGRICYTLQTQVTTDNNWLYIFHTGHPNNSVVSRIKRLRLPATLTYPTSLAVNSENGDVYIVGYGIDQADVDSLYTFSGETIRNAADNSTISQARINPFPTFQSGRGAFNGLPSGLSEYGGELYIYARSARDASWRYLSVFDIPTTDGTVISARLRGSPNIFGNNVGVGMSVTEETVWINNRGSSRFHVIGWDRELFTSVGSIEFYNAAGTTFDGSLVDGLEVIDGRFYVIGATRTLRVYYIDPEVHISRRTKNLQLTLPSGVTNPKNLSIPT